ncbi:M14 family zinc carboxypeptidase [uncultured Amphritea sp.]|uniref:M14 family zinc carboxypeptidase n=1 Tax=uncultured Amphritea sp. TaxID=981605 RepID=UPI00260B913C|nr:M14 family zinc carboxypeptidase [uncultured Amphritea sp.]
MITILVTGLTLGMVPPALSEPADPLSLYTDASHSETNSQSNQITIADQKQISVLQAHREPDIETVLPTTASKLANTSDTPAVSEVDTDAKIEAILTSDTQPKIPTETDAKTETISQVKTAATIENAPDKTFTPEVVTGPHEDVISICKQIGEKLGSVSAEECLAAEFSPPRFYSHNHLPLLEKHFPASPNREDPPRILFLGGIHGDEYSSVSISFKWLKILQESHNGTFDWHFMPLTNPDGLLQNKSTRVNANKVDLNRNFIPAETSIDPLQHWQNYARKRARYYPGTKPLSEPETQAIHQLIDRLRPDVIVSVHAPHGILDYDGTITPPRNLGPLQLKQLGTYPGSLGNYGWFVKQIPVMTIELKHAGIMPGQNDIDRMWADLIQWIQQRTEGDGTLLARKESMRERKPTL